MALLRRIKPETDLEKWSNDILETQRYKEAMYDNRPNNKKTDLTKDPIKKITRAASAQKTI